MSEMKYCQGPKCHTYRTKDRIRGPKGAKNYQTRKRTSFYYLGGNACGIYCERDWYEKFGEMAVNHFGRIHEPKRTSASGAWYKHRSWRGYDNTSITSSMICLANADQLHKNNIEMKILLVHNKWSTR